MKPDALGDGAAHALQVGQLGEELRDLARRVARSGASPFWRMPAWLRPDVDVHRDALFLGGRPERVVVVGELRVAARVRRDDHAPEAEALRFPELRDRHVDVDGRHLVQTDQAAAGSAAMNSSCIHWLYASMPARW